MAELEERAISNLFGRADMLGPRRYGSRGARKVALGEEKHVKRNQKQSHLSAPVALSPW